MSDESDTKPERKGSAPKPPEQRPAASDLMSPREHALATGNGPPKRKSQWVGAGFSPAYGSTAHEIAKALHGWADHEHEPGKPFQLSRADYLAALAATMPEVGNPVPHPAALSPYKGKRGAIALGKSPTERAG